MWDNRWMDMACLVASWSKDKSRKTGAVIVDDRNNLIAIGWNGFPRGVNDNNAERHMRPAKYQWTEHAERNAIYNAAANGYPVRNSTMYIPWYPCADCARSLIQSGVTTLVCIQPDWNDHRWGNDFLMVKQMLKEADIQCQFMSGYAPLTQ